MRTVVDLVLTNVRKLDKVVMHCIAIPVVVLLFVRGSNYANAQSFPSQEAINATQTEKIQSLDQRLSHLEKSADAQFVALLGVFAALLINAFQNKNRRVR